MSVLIQDLGQSGMGTPHLNCPSKPLCVTGIPSSQAFPVKARGSYWLRLRLGARNDIRALLGNQ